MSFKDHIPPTLHNAIGSLIAAGVLAALGGGGYALLHNRTLGIVWSAVFAFLVIAFLIAFFVLRHRRQTPPSQPRGDRLNNQSKAVRPPQSTIPEANTVKEEWHNVLHQFEVEWLNEREGQPVSTDCGKDILHRLENALFDLRAQLNSKVTKVLLTSIDGTIRMAKQIQRHQVYLDGGVSFKAFWQAGDGLFTVLREISAQIDSHVFTEQVATGAVNGVPATFRYLGTSPEPLDKPREGKLPHQPEMQPVFTALDDLKALHAEGEMMLKNFSEPSPTRDDVLNYREKILTAAKQRALEGYVKPLDVQKLQEPFLDSTEMLLKANIADSGDGNWIFETERLETYDLLYPRVRRLEQLISRIETMSEEKTK